MRKTVVIVDNFYEDPDAVRAYGMSQPMYFPYQTREDVLSGRTWPSWYTTAFTMPERCPFKASRSLFGAIEVAIGERIDVAHWNGYFPVTEEGRPDDERVSEATTALWNCCFHVKPENKQPLGEGVHNHVVDTWNGVGENGWSGLIYLNRNAPLRGGLKTWKNRDPEKTFDWMTPASNWELVDDYGNVFNRLVLTRGDIPHSGAQGWGRNVQNGRFYQTFFFRTEPSPSPVVQLAI